MLRAGILSLCLLHVAIGLRRKTKRVQKKGSTAAQNSAHVETEAQLDGERHYAIGTRGQYWCPVGFSRDTTESECEDAAEKLGKRYDGVVDTGSKQTGCHYYKSNWPSYGLIEYVAFNTHWNGRNELHT